MSQTYQSLAHPRWDCKYHVVFVAKRRLNNSLDTFARHSDRSFMSWHDKRSAGSLQVS